jgi:hypothetical protein
MNCTRYASECKRNCAGKCQAENLYRPSNGTEGMIFTEQFCDHCLHENPDPNSRRKCELLTASMCFAPTEPEYPKEWIYDALGHPVCTKFINWNWNKNGDPDDPDNPLAPPPPPDPNQLDLFPLYPHEEIFSKPVVIALTSI